jgi:hypothetical protein
MARSRHALFALALLAPLTALGTVVLSLTFEELTTRAPLVVHAKVNASSTAWDAERAKIWTWTELVVKDTLKGAPVTTVLVKQPGGIVGEVGMEVAGVATFAPGEEVVLFLEPAPDEKGTWVPVSMSASKVTFEDRLGVKTARRDLSGLAFAKPGQQYVALPVDEREVVGTAEAFLARVRAAVKRGGK